MTQVIKVSQAGYDVLTESDKNNYIFDSTVNTFKILSEGTLLNQTIDSDPKTLTVAHGQSSTPAIYTFAKFADGYIALPREKDYSYTVDGVRTWIALIDSTNIKFLFYKGATVTESNGYRSPNTATSTNGIGTIAWANYNDALSSNNVYATATFTAVATSEYLKITNFGFSVPTDATITGIYVQKEGHYTTTDTLLGSSMARLIKAGSVVGNTKTTNFPLNIDSTITEGGSSDMWGITLTPAQVNASNFGVALWTDITTVSGTGVIKVDTAEITVYYTRNGGNYSVDVKYYIFESPAT